MTIITNGIIVDKRITAKRYNSIEHGDINQITSIVLHRTAGSSALSSLNGYASGQNTGAHFLIARKKKAEGVQLLQYLKVGVAP